jgi:hypothetical protein
VLVLFAEPDEHLLQHALDGLVPLGKHVAVDGQLVGVREACKGSKPV